MTDFQLVLVNGRLNIISLAENVMANIFTNEVVDFTFPTVADIHEFHSGKGKGKDLILEELSRKPGQLHFKDKHSE